MAFFRNKEIKVFTLFILVVSIIITAAAFRIGKSAGFVTLTAILLLCAVFYLYTLYRYKCIEKLTEYLSHIRSGKYSLDIRDNYEGELSILKSEIYKVTRMLSEYNEKLKQDKLLLADQMADISHQLKTPLTSMQVMLDLLSDDNMQEAKRKEFINHIQIQLERIEWLVSSLLKMSKLDADVAEMQKKDIAAEDLIKMSFDPLSISMELKEIRYTYHSPAHFFINCDPNWTSEALTNIIKNCIEHTPKGGRISISTMDNPLYIEIRIADNGIGIDKEDLPHIFTRFYKGRNSSPDSVGIGLAMALSIIRNQGGDITVTSQTGRGTEFSVRLYKSII
jgi:signal transduction histidine kinase